MILSKFTHIVTVYLPWFLSALTIYQTFLSGKKHHNTWLVGLFGQSLWFIWTVVSENWGLLPLNLTLTYMYTQNHIKWNKEKWKKTKSTSSAY